MENSKLHTCLKFFHSEHTLRRVIDGTDPASLNFGAPVIDREPVMCGNEALVFDRERSTWSRTSHENSDLIQLGCVGFHAGRLGLFAAVESTGLAQWYSMRQSCDM